MKIKILVVALIVLSVLQSSAQMINSTVVNPKTKSKMLVGYCDKSGLEKGNFGVYFNSQYDVYKPSKKYIKKIESKIDDTEITIVFGTWCSDSQREVPRFFKILNDAGYNDKRIKLIAVDKNKEAIVVNIKNLDVQKIPTFIIYKNNVEIGRIVETPKKLLEKDLWNIIK